MSRSQRFVTGLLSSYASIGVNILYTIASVPLALHYLNKEEFGLWALVTQLAGYLMLLEFGMRGSVARLLSDHKDRMEDGVYGNILRTGARVFAIQGFVVTLLGLAVAWFAPALLDLPTHLQHPFAILMVAQAVIGGLGLALGSLGSPLWCHQRLDISNLASSISLVVAFAALWLGFHWGWQIYSLTLSTIIGFLVGSAITYFACLRLGLYPTRANRGHFDGPLFRELFHFGSGLFLMNLGAQLASASQVIVVSRLLGVEAATVWSVATKLFNMAQQFVSRVLDSSAGGLAEMVVREEFAQLQKRFHDLVAISALMAVAASAAIALTNGAFIELWTSGRVTWAPWNNMLLACVLFSMAVTRCHTGLVGISKLIRGMKYAYLIEGLAFVALALLLVPRTGLTGLLIAALICNVAITGNYGINRSAHYFDISRLQVIGWIARPTVILVATGGLFSLFQLSRLAELQALPRFVIGIIAYCGVVIPAIWLFGMKPSLRLEIKSLISKIQNKAKSMLRIA